MFPELSEPSPVILFAPIGNGAARSESPPDGSSESNATRISEIAAKLSALNVAPSQAGAP